MKGFLRFTIGGAAMATILSGCIHAHPPYRARIPSRNVSRAVQPSPPNATAPVPAVAVTDSPRTEDERRYAVAP